MPAPDQGNYYYDAQGNLFVWTGSGYQVIPRIAANDITLTPASSRTVYYGDSGAPSDEYVPGSAMFSDPSLAAKYGVGDFNSGSANFATNYNDPNSFGLKLKSADKEGSDIKYTLKDGYYVPEYQGTGKWDTNSGNMNRAALLAFAALGGGAALGNSLLGAEAAAGAAGAGAEGLIALGEGAVPALTSAPTIAEATWLDSLLSGLPAGLKEVGSALLSNPTALKLAGTAIGGLIGKATSGNEGGGGGGGSGGNSGPTGGPVQAPTMYGGNGQSGAYAPSFPMVGNSETERRMTQQYLPSLFQQGQNRSGIGPMQSAAGLGGMGAMGGLLGGFGGPAGPQPTGVSMPGLIGAPPGAMNGDGIAASDSILPHIRRMLEQQRVIGNY